MSSGNFLPTFWDNLSIPSSGFKNPKGLPVPREWDLVGCPETSVRNFHYSLCNNPEERSFQILRSRSLKSCIGSEILVSPFQSFPPPRPLPFSNVEIFWLCNYEEV
jgi:hypothetical protein